MANESYSGSLKSDVMHLEMELTEDQERTKSFQNKRSHPSGSHGGREVTSCQKLSSPRQNKPDM